MMKKLAIAAALVFAASVSFSQTAQQSLMGTCNKEAADKKGQERKDFMKTCLSDGKKRQQERMKTCNVEVKGMKGDERKTALSACLKK